MKTLGERLVWARDSIGWKQNEAAERIGVSNIDLNRYEKDKRRPDPEKLARIANTYRVSAHWLVTGTGDPWSPHIRESVTPYDVGEAKETVCVPIVGAIRCGEPIYAEESLDGWLLLPEPLAQPNDFLLRVTGDSMAPRILEGDLVLIRPGTNIVNGEIYAVLVENAMCEATLKRVYKNDGETVLAADNRQYQPLVFTGRKIKDVRIIGKMVRFIGK